MPGSAESEPGGLRAILADRSVVTVVSLAFVVMLGTGLVLPILPLYVRSFGVGYDDVGLLVAAYAITRLCTDLASGLVVDRFGERLTAAAGLSLVSVSALATGLAPSYAAAVGFWAGAGLGSALVFAAMFSHLLKVVPAERMARTLSVFYGSFNVGVVLGGFAAGLIADRLGLASPLFFLTGTSLIAAVLYLRRLRPSGGELRATEIEPPALTTEEAMLERDIAAPRHGRLQLLETLRTPGFPMAIAATFAYLWIVVAVFDTLVPLFATDELGMSTIGIGIVFAVALAAELAVLYAAGVAADRRGRKVVLVPSFALLGLLTVALGFAHTPLVLGLGMALLGIASGFAGVPAAAILADVVPKERSASGVALFRFAGDLGFTLGPLAAGFAASGLGFEAAFAVVAAPTLIALLVGLRSKETLRRKAAPA
jgi:MFS family permease